MKFSVFQLSRRGGREKNEDRMGYSYTRDAGLFALADGMGGHPDGEVAAQIALQTLSALFQREARPRLAAPASFLAASLMGAHHQIIRYASERGLLDTPRTTLVAALAQGGELHWMHCGDSRLYVVRDGQLLLRTRDHSYSEAQANAGMATEGINRNVLFTCLGSTVRPMFDVAGPLRLLEGDRVLLCSDGLWGSLADELIVSTLGTLPVAKAVPTLVDAALQAAGEHSDNVNPGAERRGVRLHHPGRGLRSAAGRPGRRGHRALHRRDQCRHPAHGHEPALSAAVARHGMLRAQLYDPRP